MQIETYKIGNGHRIQKKGKEQREMEEGTKDRKKE
jgi:hypothetical protein